MGKKTIHVSDFTGQVLSPDDEVVKVVVLEHPDLVAGPGVPVLDLTVPLVQPASIVAITAAVTRTEPRRVGRMTPLSTEQTSAGQ